MKLSKDAKIIMFALAECGSGKYPLEDIEEKANHIKQSFWLRVFYTLKYGRWVI